MDRDKQRLNRTGPLPSKKALISEGSAVLRKASTCQQAAGLPRCPPSEHCGQMNVGMEDATQASNTGDWDSGGATHQAGSLKSAKGP